MEIRNSIIKIVQNLEKDIAFDSGDSLVENGLLDSLSVLELVNQLEASFGFFFDEDDLSIENFETVEKIEEVVLKYIGK